MGYLSEGEGTSPPDQRAAEILLEDMEARGPVRLSDVEAAQREILAIVKRMADEGTVTIGGNAETML